MQQVRLPHYRFLTTDRQQMPIQREKSQSMSAGDYSLKYCFITTYNNSSLEGSTGVPWKELRQILQMLQRLSVLHPEQFCRELSRKSSTLHNVFASPARLSTLDWFYG